MTNDRHKLLESYIREALKEYSSRYGDSYVQPSGIWSTVIDKLSGFFGLKPSRPLPSSRREDFVDRDDDYGNDLDDEDDDYMDDNRIRGFIMALQSWFGKLEAAYGRRLPEGKKLEIASAATRMYQRFLKRSRNSREATVMTLGYLSSRYGLTKKSY